MGKHLVEPESVDRPEPQLAVTERIRAWAEWFGLARLVTSAVATVIVCGGAFWLLRTPPPPTEANLPVASSGSSPLATLTPPATSTSSPLESAPTGLVTVHVAGAVVSPGVYVVPATSRVDDAVAAAGGPIGSADLDALNLASMVIDGSRIYVPEEGEPVVAPITPTGTDGSGGAATSGPIDLNQATASQLETLPGIGPATATAIVAERDRNGPFASAADLERVPGIGPAKMLALSGLVTT